MRFHCASPTARLRPMPLYFNRIVLRMSFIHVYASFNEVRSSWHWQMPSMSWVMDFIWQVHYNFNDDGDMLTRTALMMNDWMSGANIKLHELLVKWVCGDGVECEWGRNRIWMFSTRINNNNETDWQIDPSDSKRYNENGFFFRALEWRIESALFGTIFFVFEPAFCRRQLRLIETIRTFNDLTV